MVFGGWQQLMVSWELVWREDEEDGRRRGHDAPDHKSLQPKCRGRRIIFWQESSRPDSWAYAVAERADVTVIAARYLFRGSCWRITGDVAYVATETLFCELRWRDTSRCDIIMSRRGCHGTGRCDVIMSRRWWPGTSRWALISRWAMM